MKTRTCFVGGLTALLLTLLGAQPVWASGETIFSDDFDDGNADGWVVLAGTWSVQDGYYEQTSSTLGGMSETEEWIDADLTTGVAFSVNTRIVEGLGCYGREVDWRIDGGTRIWMEYIGHQRELRCRCNINGSVIFNDHIVPSYEEWTGTDGMWHELSFTLLGNRLEFQRDGEHLFTFQDDVLYDMPYSCKVLLHTWGSHTAFDDVTVSTVLDPTRANSSTWGAIKRMFRD